MSALPRQAAEQARELEFLAALERQRADYGRALPARIAEIESRWHDVAGGRASRDDLQELLRAAHSLAGSAGTFGYVAVGRGARQLEERLRALLASPAPDEAAVRAAGAALDGLKSGFERARP